MGNRLRVHVMFEHDLDDKPGGSSYIRLLLPLTHPSNESHLDVTFGLEYQKSDVLVLDRTWHPQATLNEVRELIRIARRDRVRIVYFLDDNILDLKQKPPLKAWPQDELKLIIEYIIRRSDCVAVTTEALRSRLLRLNANTIVLPNALDEGLFFSPGINSPKKELDDGTLTIGYMGTYTHDEDLLMILQPLRSLLRGRNGQVRFEVLGGLLDRNLMQLFDELPAKLTLLDDEDVEYKRFVPWMRSNISWDVAIAPLVDDSFTQCKSDIKFLDYAALGIPGIYSDVPAYKNSVTHLRTGYLAANDSAAWSGAFERMLDDSELRKRIANEAKGYVLKERTLEVCAQQWSEVLLNLSEGVGSDPAKT